MAELLRVDAGANSAQHPDPEWMQKVFAIQEASASLEKLEEERSSFRVARMVQGHVAKRRRTEVVVVPEVHTYRAVEVSRGTPTDCCISRETDILIVNETVVFGHTGGCAERG